MKITEKRNCEDQIVTFKQGHILLYQGLLFLTRSRCVIVDARSHTCKSHDFIPRYDIKIINSSPNKLRFPLVSGQGATGLITSLFLCEKRSKVVYPNYEKSAYITINWL